MKFFLMNKISFFNRLATATILRVPMPLTVPTLLTKLRVYSAVHYY